MTDFNSCLSILFNLLDKKQGGLSNLLDETVVFLSNRLDKDT
ncbi:hypothetical protein BACCELL_03557 [Bacteroides cellulosilyticus DSM 14838]|jgi:hypothetical protein|uniref:Uncharacterized protein n=1 Tax=Bacteroides cellulosilyticus DSM 14838 TaxID=537012 RepID=E2NGY3_9BACE|nr:hypothetical protein BACCELL_03557 [Bacteroides cellulosilyticus DSM 14838]